MDTAAPHAPASPRDRVARVRQRLDDRWKGAPRWQKVLAVVLLAIVVLVLAWDWNWFKGPIERRVETATGRQFEIEGDLDVDLHWTRPTVIANDVVLGNAAWSKTDDEMFRVDQARITWAFWRMFKGQVLLPRIELDRPNLLMERDGDGRANWTFRDDGDAPDYPDIGQLLVDGGRFRLLEPSYRTDIRVFVQSGEPEAGDALAPLLLDGDGTYRDGDFELEGRVDSPLEFIDRDEAYRVDLRARAGGTKAHAFGGLAVPLDPDAFDIGFELSGGDLAELYTLFGLALPRTPAYRLEGTLARDGKLWHYRGFKGVVGDSDLAGDATVDPSGKRMKLTANLVSARLDFDDLSGFIGGTPRAGEGRAAAPAVPGDPNRVFPAREYDIGKLRSMDADVRLRATRVNSPKLPLENMLAHLKLVDGDLRLDPLDFGIASGEIESTVHLDARQAPIAATVDVTARGLDLGQLTPKSAPPSAGRIGGRVRISGRGNSVASLVATADGEAQLGMGRGKISNLLLELAGIDIYEALKFMIGKDRIIPIRCAYADMAIQRGVAQSRQMAFDTTDTVLFVEGQVHLGEERYDLRLKPRPKDPSPISLRSPLRLTGTLKHPKIRPEAGPLIARGLLAAALYAVAPPAALLALIETGPGEDTGCGAENPKLRAQTPADDQAGPPTDG
jgi:AsmA family protein